MKRWIKWIVLALVLAAIAVAVARALATRKAQQQATLAAATTKAVTLVELVETDVVRARTRELSRGLPVSGTLRAVHSAVVRARVAGELQHLSVREGEAVKAGQVIARSTPPNTSRGYSRRCSRPKRRKPRSRLPSASSTTARPW
jgi:multidrug efflux pump subunit AcrA (membrane-fusion protein)